MISECKHTHTHTHETCWDSHMQATELYRPKTTGTYFTAYDTFLTESRG